MVLLRSTLTRHEVPGARTADQFVEQRGVGAVQDDQHEAPQQHVHVRRVAQRRPRAL